MPRYHYIAKSQPEQTVNGTVEADSSFDALQKLNKQGLFALSVQPEEEHLQIHNLLTTRTVPRRDIALFTRQLSHLLESGINILSALSIIINQTKQKYLRPVLMDIAAQIKDGKSFSQAIRGYSRIFSPLYTAMIHTGESSGTLERSFHRLADFMDKEDEFISSLRQALAYPIFIMFVSILTIVVLIGFVIPRLTGMFEDLGQILPLPTKIMIAASDILRIYWWLIAAILFICLFVINRFYRTAKGKQVFDSLCLKLPVAGDMFLKTEIERMTRTLSLLLASGIPIIQALDITKGLITNSLIKAELETIKDKITQGGSFAGAIKETKFLPQMVTSLIAVGEESGNLERSLLRIADGYENEVNEAMKTITRLLEPAIILVMGLIVGFVVLSMLLPVFQINTLVR